MTSLSSPLAALFTQIQYGGSYSEKPGHNTSADQAKQNISLEKLINLTRATKVVLD